jgi:hypothetical protein
MVYWTDPPPRDRRHALAAGAACLTLLGLGVYLFFRSDNEWERVFVPAAARLWSGGDVYQADGRYLYPPFTAWVVLPIAGMSHAASRIVFVAVNLCCLVYVLRGAWRLAADPPLRGRAAVLAALAGAACGIFYLFNSLVHQQTDVVIAALLVGGCLALRGGRTLRAATAFGLAAAMKCTSLLWAPYLLWRRRPVAAAWLVAVAAGANLLPDLVNGPAEGGIWMGVFVSRHLAPLTDREHVPGSWGSEILYNQSLAGATQRWLLTAPHWSETGCDVVRHGAGASPRMVQALLYSVEVLLACAAARVFGRPFRAARDRRREVLEYSAVLLLMLLLSPMSSAAHFGTLVLPGMCLARRATGDRDRVLVAILVPALLAAFASNKDLIGGSLYTIALWGGCVMLNALLLLAGCLREMERSDADLGPRPRARGAVSAVDPQRLRPAARPPEALVSSPACTRAFSSSA